MGNRVDRQQLAMPPEDKELLAEIAQLEDRSMSAVVRSQLRRRAVELGLLPVEQMPPEYREQAAIAGD